MIVRLAHEASWPPQEKDADGYINASDMTVEERKAQPLAEKLKNIIPMLLENVCDARFRQRWYDYPVVFHADKGLYYLDSAAYF